MKTRRLLITVPFAALLLVATPVPQTPRESPRHYQLDDGGAAGRGAPAVLPVRRAVEPLAGPAADREAAREALEGRAPDLSAGASSGFARALSRLAAEPGPPDELLALVKVTDRRTGERRVLARGTLSPGTAALLADPSGVQDGFTYEEADDVTADAEVEIAVRSVSRRARRAAAGTHPTPEEEEELDLRRRGAGRGVSHRFEEGLAERIARGRIDLASTLPTPVVINMKHVTPLRLPRSRGAAETGLLWAGLDAAAARQRAIIERKRSMRALQAGLEEAIEGAGGRVLYASWTGGSVRAEVPASLLAVLARRPDVLSIEAVEPMRALSHTYRGDDYFVATDAEDFDQFHDGHNGVLGKHDYSSRVILALGEECLDLTNPAWLNAGPGSLVRGWFYDCDPGGACQQGGVEECSGADNHGTRVAQIMTADFMQGQDPNMSAARRRLLTGTCPDCRFFFLQDFDLDQRDKVHDAACDLGVDVFESSIGTRGLSCDGHGPWDTSLEGLINCDAVYIQAAGNEGSTGGCTTISPADHPWTFAVGGMDSEDPCNTSGAYYTADCPYDDGASRGGIEYDQEGVASVIDMTAPYRFGNMIRPLTRNPVDYGTGAGTSFATPLVAGLTAEFMDWWHVHVSDSIFFDNRARTVMLLFGDRSSEPEGTMRLTDAFDTYWGAGRVGLVPFDDKTTWGISRRSRTLDPDEPWTFSVTVDPAATFFKAVVWHDGQGYFNQPMIRMTLDPRGCANPTLSVDRLEHKAMLVYTDLDGCTSIDITVENLLAGLHWARKFQFAAYSDTEDERHF